MTDKILYINPEGKNRSRSSYSARKAFKFCKRKFFLTYIQGWREKTWGISTVFGNVIEASIQFHIQNGCKGGVEKFVELWEKARKAPDYSKYRYTELEESWENLLRCGRELMIIFAARLSRLPIIDARANIMPRFQVPLRKAVFPNTPGYENIENDAYLDMLTAVGWDHPALEKIEKTDELRHVLIDVKTASKALRAELIRLDPQLLEYSWMLRKAMDAAFLWLVKATHGYKAGSYITLLEDAEGSPWKAGFEMTVLQKGKTSSLIGPRSLWIYGQALPEERREISWQIAGAVEVPNTIISKQRLQFAVARLTDDEVDEAGRLVGQTTVEMILAHEEQFYPMEGGIRFPDEKCNTCSMRFICAHDSKGRDANLTRAGEEWLDVVGEV